MKGHLRQPSPGSWELSIYMGRDTSGKPKYQTITVRGTKRDAERALREGLQSVDNGTYAKPSKPSVADYLKRWLRDYAKTTVGVTSCERYEQTVRRHLVPELGAIPLAQLRPLDIQAFYSRLLEQGYAAKSVLLYHRILYRALSLAVKWELLPSNPAASVVPPHPDPPKVEALDEDQIERLLKGNTREPVPYRHCD